MFGSTGKCDDFGLGMIESGCDPSRPNLQDEIGNNGPNKNEPPGNSFGCLHGRVGRP